MAGPEDKAAAAEDRSRGDLRASHADREQVIGTLKAAFVQGRLTRDDLDERVDQVYASRTYAELAEVTAEVTADIPAELTGAQSQRDPWRATKIAWRVEYTMFLPGVIAFLLLPAGPHTTAGEVIILTAVVYLLFWILGVSMMIASRPAKCSGGQPPPQSAPGRQPATVPTVTARPGEEIVAGGRRLPVTYADRERVIRTLEAARAQGRLTEDEHEERTAGASVSRSHAELAALTADLPAGLTAVPPTARDVRIGVGMSITAACVLAALLLWRPDNGLAFIAFLGAAAILIVLPVITVGLIVDVRHQKRSGGQLPPGPGQLPAGPTPGALAS
jgi:hypothetical protein